MNAITPVERQALAQAGRLRGFFSGAGEIDEAPVQVHGQLPAWLKGDLLLNGPALWELPHGAYRHWFDGLAMLHRVRLGQGEAGYRSRFLRSQDHALSTATGRPAMGGFGTDEPPGVWRRLRGVFSPRITDNAAVVMSRVGGGWAATTETPHIVGFDPVSLETTGGLRFDDGLKLHLMSAHGINDADDTYWNVGVALGPTCAYKLFRVRPGERRRELVGSFQTPKAGYLHGFALTPRHAVICETALRAQPLAFMFSGRSYLRKFRWEPDSGSKLHAISLADGSVRSWSVPPLMCFHFVQAYETDDGLVAELCAFDDAQVMEELMLQPRRQGVPLRALANLVRFRLRPGQPRSEPEPVATGLELPQVHPSRWARAPASVVWGAGVDPDGAAAFFDRTVRIELQGGERIEWQRGNAVQLEPLYVPRPGGTDENDGVLLVPTLADDDTGTLVAVLDPGSMRCIATLQLPQVVPFGFHAAWNPAA